MANALKSSGLSVSASHPSISGQTSEILLLGTLHCIHEEEKTIDCFTSFSFSAFGFSGFSHFTKFKVIFDVSFPSVFLLSLSSNESEMPKCAILLQSEFPGTLVFHFLKNALLLPTSQPKWREYNEFRLIFQSIDWKHGKSFWLIVVNQQK